MSRTMQETVDLIEKGLEDIKKGSATKAEVLQLIDDRVKEDKAALAAAQADLKTVKTEAEELKAQAKEFSSKLQQLRSNSYAALKNADGSYRGLLGSPMIAKAFGLMCMAAATANTKQQSRHDAALKALENMGISMKWLDAKGNKVMTTGAQANGSALVTTEMIPTLITQFEQHGIFEADALTVPMGTGSTLQPKTDELLDLYCPGEGGTIDADDPKIKLISHTLKTLCAMTAYSIELDEDSAIELGEMIAFIMVQSFGYGIDKCAFLGDGTSTYFGFKGIVGSLLAVDSTISKIRSLVVGSGNAYSELVIGDFNKLVGTLPSSADDGNANFYCHKYFYYTVMIALALAAGGVTANEVIMGAGQRQKSYLSYPVRFTQVMPSTAANDQICCLLANLKQGAQFGRRGVLEIAQSTERYFEQALIALRARRRVSINIHGVGGSTDNAKSQAGPICGLITAHS